MIHSFSQTAACETLKIDARNSITEYDIPLRDEYPGHDFAP